MRNKDWFWLATGVSAGALLYGMVVESNRLVVKHQTLQLPNWPKSHDRFKIALLGDFHVREEWSTALAARAVEAALDEEPDMVCLVGDYVGYWKPEVIDWLGEILEPLLLMNANVVAVPGNHDYLLGDPSILKMIFDELNIKLLRNESWIHHGINWVGIDSANATQADPVKAAEKIDSSLPSIALWHEPDLVDYLVGPIHLMLAGHSHGGQFLMPWGTPFVGSTNGRKYRRGHYPEATTPVFTTSGIGTTGPPSRLFCPPEVVILTLEASE